MPAERMTRMLDQAIERYGKPRRIRSDNGPEFRARALDAWANRHGIEHHFIRPGKPVENAFAESFNGRVRDEFLNQHCFHSIRHARDLSAEWRDDYNQLRPHTALGGLSPEQHIAKLRGPLGAPSGPTQLRRLPTHRLNPVKGSLLPTRSPRNERIDQGGCLTSLGWRHTRRIDTLRRPCATYLP